MISLLFVNFTCMGRIVSMSSSLPGSISKLKIRNPVCCQLRFTWMNFPFPYLHSLFQCAGYQVLELKGPIRNMPILIFNHVTSWVAARTQVLNSMNGEALFSVASISCIGITELFVARYNTSLFGTTCSLVTQKFEQWSQNTKLTLNL